MEKLRYAVRGRSDIILRDGYLSATQNNALVALSDCYVSLHRAEGFGLTIAEAMALGKPAIATAYSGNLEFMTERNSFLCPCQPSDVGPGRDPYPATSHWSEPDIERAAELLQHVYGHPQEASERGLRAAEDIRTLHSQWSRDGSSAIGWRKFAVSGRDLIRLNVASLPRSSSGKTVKILC